MCKTRGACDDATTNLCFVMPTCAHASATTLRLADAWFSGLHLRVATILDNATYTDAGCKRLTHLARRPAV